MVKRKRVQSSAAHTDDTNKRSNIIKALDELGTTSATPNAKSETVDGLDSAARVDAKLCIEVLDHMVHGNTNECVEKREGVNRVQLLADAANELEYMHDFHMVQGDLKGANILINKKPRWLCRGFLSLNNHWRRESCCVFKGVSNIVRRRRWDYPVDESRISRSGTIRNFKRTTQSDCYAPGMVI